MCPVLNTLGSCSLFHISIIIQLSAMEYSWSICSIDAHSKICGSACETARYFYSGVLPGPFSRTLLIELIYNRSKLALSCWQYRLTSMPMWDQTAFGF